MDKNYDAAVSEELNYWRERYGIGRIAAGFLVKQREKFVHKADFLRAKFFGADVPAGFAPSHIELENVAACFYDITDGIAGIVDNACDALEYQYSEVSFPNNDAIAKVVVWKDDLDRFLDKYAGERVEAKKRDDGHRVSGFVEVRYDAADNEYKNDVEDGDENDQQYDNYDEWLRGVSIVDAVDDYVCRKEDCFDGLMSNFPEKARSSTNENIERFLGEKVNSYVHGEYRHGLEHRFLADLEVKGLPQYDDLYARLRRAKKLNDSGMQRVYLVRHIHRFRTFSSSDFYSFLAARQEAFHAFFKGVDQTSCARAEKRRLDFIKLCAKENMAWLDAFLEH